MSSRLWRWVFQAYCISITPEMQELKAAALLPHFKGFTISFDELQ
jgi:hypothetical protein